MDRLYLDELRLRHSFGHFHLRLRSQDFKVETETDHNLGHIMSAFSVAMKELHAQRTGQMTERQTAMLTGTITLDTWTIEDCWVAPFWWVMTMTAGLGRFSYTVRMDRDVEHVLLAFQGAMKFFAFKYGITTLDSELIRNRDKAGEAGLLTKEDFHA